MEEQQNTTNSDEGVGSLFPSQDSEKDQSQKSGDIQVENAESKDSSNKGKSQQPSAWVISRKQDKLEKSLNDLTQQVGLLVEKFDKNPSTQQASQNLQSEQQFDWANPAGSVNTVVEKKIAERIPQILQQTEYQRALQESKDMVFQKLKTEEERERFGKIIEENNLFEIGAKNPKKAVEVAFRIYEAELISAQQGRNPNAGTKGQMSGISSGMNRGGQGTIQAPRSEEIEAVNQELSKAFADGRYDLVPSIQAKIQALRSRVDQLNAQ